MDIVQIHQTKIQNEVAASVSARDLHLSLNISKDFSNWIKTQIDRAGLIENVDFVSFAQKGEREIGATIRIEYILTLDAAKHIAMMSQSKQAKAVREYFIEVEKRYKQIEHAYHQEKPHKQSQEIIDLTKAIMQQTELLMKQNEQISARIDRLEERYDSAEQGERGASASHVPIVPRWILASGLTSQEKLICGTIATFTDERGYCLLTNEDFATMHRLRLRSIETLISSLYGRGIVKNSGTKFNRKLTLIKLLGRK